MLGLWRRRAEGADRIAVLHDSIVAASRDPALYGADALPDTVDGRFESLTLHVLLVLRRLRALPAPAGDVAQELVDMVFARLEVALRESGIGDFGVPKRMKKLAQGFYDRSAAYDAALDEGGAAPLASALAARHDLPGGAAERIAMALLTRGATLAGHDLGDILAGSGFAAPGDVPR